MFGHYSDVIHVLIEQLETIKELYMRRLDCLESLSFDSPDVLSASPEASSPGSLAPIAHISSSSAAGIVMHITRVALSHLTQVQTPESPSLRPFKIARYENTGTAVDPVADLVASASAIVQESDPFEEEPDQWEQALDQQIGGLRSWATNQNVNPDIQQERASICKSNLKFAKQVIECLRDPDAVEHVDVIVKNNILVNLIFHETFMAMQDKLMTLRIEYKYETTDSGMLDLQEIDKLKSLRELSIEGLGVKSIQLSEEHSNVMEKIEIIETDISELTDSIANFPNLKVLTLDRNRRLINLPRSLVRLNTLQCLSLVGCVALQNLPDSSPNPLHATDRSYRFSNLLSLENLYLNACHALKAIPQSICELSALKYLDLEGCSDVETLPECMDALTSLEVLKFDAMKIESLPIGLLRLALNKHPFFLPSPWNETVQWMCTALASARGQSRDSQIPYKVIGDTLRIEIKRNTTIPFAQEHLQLLVEALERDSPLVGPPPRVFVTYGAEAVAIDGGGL